MVTAPGWQRIGPDPAIAAWAAAALPVAQRVARESAEEWRCGNTWFVGVDALPSDQSGRVGNANFPWEAIGLSPCALHPAQLSIIRPGYPRPWQGEDAAGFAFRLRRDAAHLDGLLPIGPEKRRMVKEPHAWILGLPLNDCGAGASPLVVWEGSHLMMAAALRAAFAGHPPSDWASVDVTEVYRAARAAVFRSCARVEVPVKPGEATLLHRHLIHGVAPWLDGAEAPEEGRMIAYFRPLMASVAEWIAPD